MSFDRDTPTSFTTCKYTYCTHIHVHCTFPIVGNFHQGEITAYFATKLEWRKTNWQNFCMFKFSPLVTVHHAYVVCERCRGEVNVYVITTNATLSPPHSSPATSSERRHNVYKELKFFRAKIWECPKINLAQCRCDRFGEIFTWRKCPAIRYCAQ